jgi:aminotransferase in exopolysaccharide biosynthesis
MIDLSPPNIQGNSWGYVKDCLDTGWVGYAGKYVDMLEAKVCEYTGAKYAVATVSGTAALETALRTAGVESGDEVIIPTVTFVATAAAVRHIGAEPIFIDCDSYFQMNADCLEKFLTQRCMVLDKGVVSPSGKVIKAIVPVHIFGDLCYMKKINELAERFELKVVEDACEALGSKHSDGRHAGTTGDLGCFSFSPNKIITAGGGGMIVTNDESYADYARYLTTTAKDDPVHYIHHHVGYNYRMSNLHAALGCSQMELLDGFIDTKRKNWEYYREAFGPIEDVTMMGFSCHGAFKERSLNYWLYPLHLGKLNKKKILTHLHANDIQARPLWYLNHWQRPYRKYQSYEISQAPLFWRSVINLPSGSNLTEDEIDQVVDCIAEFACEGHFKDHVENS